MVVGSNLFTATRYREKRPKKEIGKDQNFYFNKLKLRSNVKKQT